MHHLGIDKTLFIVKQCYPGIDVKRKKVEEVVKQCRRCKEIDPVPIRWKHGFLHVKAVWDRVACDVTHYGNKKYFTLIDCGPSRFAVWKPIPDESERAITNVMSEIFRERGPPREILMDNGPAFRRSSECLKLLNK